MTEQIIYLENDDDITSMRDRLDWAQAERVLLIVPPKCKALTNAINLKLLQRHAANLALDVALVARNRSTRKLAHEIDIDVFSSVGKAQQAGWRGAFEAEELPHRVHDLDKAKIRRQPVPLQRDNSQFVQTIIAFVFFGMLFLIVLAGALFVVPSATVILIPAVEPISETIEIQADPQAETVDYEAARIPARTVETEAEGTYRVPTSSKKDTADARATGTVLFVSQVDEPVFVPLGTGVSTSSGTTVRFTTVEEATVPPKGTTEVKIVAVDAGPSGNIQQHLINTIDNQALALQLKVINDKPTSGGNVRQAGVVTQADKDRLRTLLLQQLQQKAYAKLLDLLHEQEFVPPESMEVAILDEVYDEFVGEEADALGLEMRVRAIGTAIGGHEANTLVLRLLQARVDAQHQLIPQGLEFRPGQVTTVEGRKVSFIMQASGFVVLRVEAQGIINGIRGRSVAEAKRYLSQQLALRQEPVIHVTPNWLGRVPWLPFRIFISIETGEV